MKIDCICSSKAVDYREDLNKTLSVCVCVWAGEQAHLWKSDFVYLAVILFKVVSYVLSFEWPSV